MKLPTFLVVGAAKAGTTSVYHYLKQHPEVFVTPVKETNFFALEGKKADFKGPGDDAVTNQLSITKYEEYIAQFKTANGAKALGEVCPLYLYSSEAPEKIKHYIPDVKIVAILRNPIDRAYATFMHRLKRETTTDFLKALDAEESRIIDHWDHLWHYKNMGLYSEQLSRYYSLFPKEQIKVFLYEDLCEKPNELMKDIYQFINVSDSFQPDIAMKFGASGLPKFKSIDLLLKNLGNPNIKKIIRTLFPEKIRHKVFTFLHNKNMSKKPMSNSARERLKTEFENDISQLQNLINRDLSNWLK